MFDEMPNRGGRAGFNKGSYAWIFEFVFGCVFAIIFSGVGCRKFWSMGDWESVGLFGWWKWIIF